MKAATVAAAAAAVALLAGTATAGLPAGELPPAGLPPSFRQIDRGPDGGTLWQGVIPDRTVPAARRLSVVYLPPGVSPASRYPVLYLLHGFRGSPYEYADGVGLVTAADAAIAAHAVRPFIAVAPPAGVTERFDGEWSGIWEDYVVDDVVPWVDAHLPAAAHRKARSIAGLSAGGYGAVDIGLRHPALFGTLESWSGYFRPFRDGSLAHADAAALAAHNPSLLVRAEAPRLRRLGTRFFLSSGTTHDRVSARAARAFARELSAARLDHRLFLIPGGHQGKVWRRQLPDALRYALAS